MRLGKRKRHVAEKAYPTVREYSLRGVQNRNAKLRLNNEGVRFYVWAAQRRAVWREEIS